MKFFDNILGKAGNVADYAMKKGEEVTAVAKLRVQMHTINAQLAKVYENLGRAYYDSTVNGEDNAADIADYIHQIRELEADLDDLEAELAETQGYVICPHCGEAVDNTFAFCPKCGKKLTAEDLVEEDDEDEDDEEPSEEEDEDEETETEPEQPADSDNTDGNPQA